MKNNIYNIYCDESRVENPESRKMIIGALILLRQKKKELAKQIKAIYQKHDFNYELKWTKVHKKYIDFYKDIIDFFVNEDNLSFRCIIVDKDKINLNEYHGNDPELAFFKFYYLMLRAKLLSQNKYYIFLDKKPTRDKNRVRALHAFLDMYILRSRTKYNIKHFQAYNSKENVLLQLADFLTGIMGFACNENKKRSSKNVLIEYLKKKIGKSNLCSTSFLKEEKFNVFVWRPKL